MSPGLAQTDRVNGRCCKSSLNASVRKHTSAAARNLARIGNRYHDTSDAGTNDGVRAGPRLPRVHARLERDPHRGAAHISITLMACFERIDLCVVSAESPMVSDAENLDIAVALPADDAPNQRIRLDVAHGAPCDAGRQIEHALVDRLTRAHARRTSALRSAAESSSRISSSHRRASRPYPAVGFNSGSRADQCLLNRAM